MLSDAQYGRASLSTGHIANRDHIVKLGAGIDNGKDVARSVSGYIDTGFQHDLNRKRIEFARGQSGAFGFIAIPVEAIQLGRRHLTASAISDTQTLLLATREAQGGMAQAIFHLVLRKRTDNRQNQNANRDARRQRVV